MCWSAEKYDLVGLKIHGGWQPNERLVITQHKRPRVTPTNGLLSWTTIYWPHLITKVKSGEIDTRLWLWKLLRIGIIIWDGRRTGIKPLIIATTRWCLEYVHRWAGPLSAAHKAKRHVKFIQFSATETCQIFCSLRHSPFAYCPSSFGVNFKVQDEMLEFIGDEGIGGHNGRQKE